MTSPNSFGLIKLIRENYIETCVLLNAFPSLQGKGNTLIFFKVFISHFSGLAVSIIQVFSLWA